MFDKNKNWERETFLLADDDRYVHLLLKKVFSKTGVNIIHAYNGKQAIDLALTKDISLAIIDILMPDFNGYDVLSKIKSHKPEVICVAYTADAMRIHKETIGNSMFDKVLLKPMLPFYILSEIDELLLVDKV